MGTSTQDERPRRRNLGLAIGILSSMLVAAVLALGSRSTRTTDPSGVPGIGTALGADLLPPNGDASFRTVIFVADDCALCRQRADSYIRHRRRNEATLLIVRASAAESVFGTLADQHPGLRHRIVFVPNEEFSARTGVRPVPSYVRLNEALVVTEAGMSNVGWVRSVLDPRHWLRSWKRLLGAHV